MYLYTNKVLFVIILKSRTNSTNQLITPHYDPNRVTIVMSPFSRIITHN